MTFQQLLDGAEVLAQSGNSAASPSITAIDYDSRRIRPGALFVAMKGETRNGNRFIDQAIAGGAVAVVTDSATEKPREAVAWAQVAHGRRALARVSANFYQRPAERIANIGITGTNGKSTTAFLVESILRAAGRKTVLIGTIEYHVARKVLPAPHTTPESLELNQLLAEGLAQGVTDSVMEVSSHALEQERVFGIPFDVAVFTNLTRDHLDYHGTMEEYFRAKQRLFAGCGTEPPRASVINVDDEYGGRLLQVAKQKSRIALTYGLSSGDFHAESTEITTRGTRFQMATPSGRVEMWTRMIGSVNVYNVLAASAAGYVRGCSNEHIAQGISELNAVPGRFERVDCLQPFTVVVDYAHTDDALRNLTVQARDFVARTGARGKVITLFGCGGDRDRSKRPLMGEAAGRGSDFVVLTSDNPRSEDPLAIMNDALVGLQKSGTKYATEPDRRRAMRIALEQAHPGDIVLLAGKGHEKTQVNREGTIPFNDVEVARESLKDMGYDCREAAHAGSAGKAV
jgi:UDP-N-acetylmuramoyl-L-alanyl-D-glutamate--2,6-diaminopimelate ligase